MNVSTYKEQVKALILWQLEASLGLSSQHVAFVEERNGPRVLALTAVVAVPDAIKPATRLAPSLSDACGVPRGTQIRIERGEPYPINGFRAPTLVFEVPKPVELWRPVPASAMPGGSFLRVPVGRDPHHRPVFFDFDDPLTAHLLIGAKTGGGKTTLGHNIIRSLALQNEPGVVGLVLIETANSGWSWEPFERSAHLIHPIVTDDAEALAVLDWLVEEIRRRGEERTNTPRLVVAIDEAQVLTTSTDCADRISRAASAGRKAGVHLILMYQNPSAEELGKITIKRNMARFCLSVDSTDAARVVTGRSDVPAWALTGSGDGYLVAGDVVRVQVPRIEPGDFDGLPRVDIVPRLSLPEPEEETTAKQAKAGPIEPGQVAIALSEELSINKLQKKLKVGGKKATRIKEYADQLRAALEEMGYSIIPHSESAHSDAQRQAE